MERGKFTGSNAPYGYKVDSGDALRKYVIDRACLLYTSDAADD